MQISCNHCQIAQTCWQRSGSWNVHYVTFHSMVQTPTLANFAFFNNEHVVYHARTHRWAKLSAKSLQVSANVIKNTCTNTHSRTRNTEAVVNSRKHRVFVHVKYKQIRNTTTSILYRTRGALAQATTHRPPDHFTSDRKPTYEPNDEQFVVLQLLFSCSLSCGVNTVFINVEVVHACSCK